ncbi:hypothetical protein [Mesorhizobium ciceri]|uniref:hypothetical protein n=1 Tax=Mesorhizobium TaxID=68287 RepID=UPI0012DF4B77|nr:hypothetical protein [Mesorhizobium ciceri]
MQTVVPYHDLQNKATAWRRHLQQNREFRCWPNNTMNERLASLFSAVWSSRQRHELSGILEHFPCWRLKHLRIAREGFGFLRFDNRKTFSSRPRRLP